MEQSSSGSKHESILKWIESHTNPQSLEETLESIEKVNQIILTSSPEFIFRLNKDGTYLDYRAEDETQLYYSPSEFLGKNIADLFEVGPKVRDCIGKTVATGEISYQPYQLNIQGVLRKYFATISKLNSDEALILIQEISAPVSHRKRVIGPFSFATYSNEKRHKDNSSMSTLIRNVIPIPPPTQMLKMLVITSQPIMNQNEPVALLDIENERYRISQGLKASNLGVDLRYLCEATLNNVSNVIKQQWDIIHISSHGSKDAIWLEDGLGGTYALPITEFSSWFDKNTKLVVISACETLDVGQQLFDRLQNNVIAIQGSIDDTASGVFAQYFYQALGSNNIQDSFSIAQRAVSSSAIVDSSDDLIPWSDRFKLFSCTPCIFHASSGIIQERYIPEMSFISNLPKLPTNFVGRAKDLVEVVRLFEREKTPRVCVYGPGGIGKSEFAKFVASWMRDRGHVTTVLWTTADTAESENQVLDLLSLVERIQSLFNLSEKNNLERQKNQIYQFLKTNTALLVIDSWDNLKVKDRWPIWTFLNSLPYTTRVLITSRDTLPPIEVHNYELDRLDNDKSKVLFWKTLKNAGYFKDRKALSVEETQVLSEIVDTLEGYPLAVIVAAGQTRSKTLKQIQVDFQKKPKMVLEAVNEITSQPQGVWTSLNFSYNALTEIEQQVFRQISIFPESVVDSAIHAVTRVDLVDLSNILAALVRRSLIRRSKNLFSLHKIVREYGKSKLIESDESISELHQRAIDFYLIKYSQEGEMNNLINASYHLYILFSEFSKTEAGKLFLERYPLIFLHLVFTGSWAKAIHLAEEALNVATKLDNKKIIIQAYRSLGDITLHSRMRVETATKYISQSLKLALELEDKEEILKCLNSQGYLVYLLGDTEGAKKILRESLYLSKSLEDLKEEDVAECMTALGAVYMEEGSYTEAKFMLEQSMELLQSTTTTLELTLKDRNNHHIDTQFFRIKACKWKLTAALALFAKLEHKRGDLEVAKRLYMQYLNTCKEMENVNGIAESLLQLAGIYKEEKNYSESKSLYSMALQVAYGVQAVDKVIQITFATGELFYLTGDFEKARNHFSECLQQIQANCDPKMAIKVQLAWAKLEIENSMFENATKLLKRALGSAVEAKDDASVEKIKRYLTLLEDRELNVKKIDWSSEDSSTD